MFLAAGCGAGDGTGSDKSTTTDSTGSTPAKTGHKTEHRKPPLVARKPEPHIKLPKGPPPKKQIVVRDLEEGTGAVAKTGDRLTIDWIGVYYQNGKLVGSTWEDGPFTFWLGRREGERAFSHSLQGMRVGGRRELIVPAHLTSWYQIPSDRRSQIDVVDLRGIG